MSHVSLLDTPKRASLQSRADTLRASLKDYERTFAAKHGGKKPGKGDIKADEDVSRMYKDYSRLRDVLGGKLGVEVLEEGSPKRKRQGKELHEERERKRRKSGVEGTPRVRKRGVDIVYGQGEEQDLEAEDGGQHLTAIGPTPQRDGRVMGLFDMMSNSGSGRHLWSGVMKTPGSSKRKVDVLLSLGEEDHALVAATPEQQDQRHPGDLLQFLDTATPATRRARHSRTPISEGRKFMLNQFFATPSAVRYSQIAESDTPQKEIAAEIRKTPLKNHVLGMTPNTKRIMNEDKDTTPNYLKRSHSFKDRLLSASTISAPVSTRTGLGAPLSPISLSNGPALMKPRARFQPKPLSQIAAEMRQRDKEQRDAEGDDDNGMDALRELEVAELNAEGGELGEGDGVESGMTRTYKKKGQKRTTKRVIMRPQPKLKKSTSAKQQAPVLSDDEDEIVEETQLQPATNAGNDGDDDDWSNDELFQALAANEDENNGDRDDDEDFEDGVKPAKKRAANKKETGNKEKSSSKASKTAKGTEDDDAEDRRTYNPNAASHQNYKTLKIKNKNSKGKFKGRGGRLGGRRR